MLTNAVPPKLQSLLPALFVVMALGMGGVAAILGVSGTSPLLLVAGIVGLGVIAFSLWKLEWGLAILIFLAYTRSSDVAVHVHGAPSILQPFLLVMLIGVFLRWQSTGERPQGWGRPLMLLGFYGLVRYASLFYVANFDVAEFELIVYIKDSIIAVIIVLLIQNTLTFHKAMWALLVAGAFLGSISVLQSVTGNFYNNYFGFAEAAVQHLIGDTGGFRIAGPVGDPNFYGQIIVPIVPVALERFFYERNRWLRLAALYTFGVCVLTVVFTYSRGTFVAMAAAIGLFILYRGLRWREVVLALLIALPVLQFLPAEYTQRMMTLTEILPWSEKKAVTEVSFRGRTSEALVAKEMFFDRPLLGVGLGNYPEYYQTYSQLIGLDPRSEQREPHSLYLEVASETGLMGIAAFTLLVWSMFSGIWQARRDYLAVGMRGYSSLVVAFGIGIVGYLLAAIFLHSGFPRYLYLLYGLAMATPTIAHHELLLKQQRRNRSTQRSQRAALRGTVTAKRFVQY